MFKLILIFVCTTIPPIISINNMSECTMIGQTVVLKCPLTASELNDSQLDWSVRNGGIYTIGDKINSYLAEDIKTRIKITDGTFYLQIKNVTKSDEQIYYCTTIIADNVEKRQISLVVVDANSKCLQESTTMKTIEETTEDLRGQIDKFNFTTDHGCDNRKTDEISTREFVLCLVSATMGSGLLLMIACFLVMRRKYKSNNATNISPHSPTTQESAMLDLHVYHTVDDGTLPDRIMTGSVRSVFISESYQFISHEYENTTVFQHPYNVLVQNPDSANHAYDDLDTDSFISISNSLHLTPPKRQCWQITSPLYDKFNKNALHSFRQVYDSISLD